MTNTIINKSSDEHYVRLVKELKKVVSQLRKYGLTEKDILSLLQSGQPLLALTVSKDYRMYLGEKRVEVRMEPLVKSVYLLFLRHPEGIVFKNLPDYRQELAKIYSEVRPWGLSDRALQSIEDVTNPLLNSINEKCARIRKAFAAVLDSGVVEQYYINGPRGGAKSISLPRDLIVWE
jgi:hypothetical protein